MKIYPFNSKSIISTINNKLYSSELFRRLRENNTDY